MTMGLLLAALQNPTSAFLKSSSGNASLKNETEDSIDKKIKKGKTTKKQVKAMFGSPLATHITDSGLEVWTYHYFQDRQNAMNFVPYANKVQSGSKGTRKELKIVFKESGVVKHYSMNESKLETKSGFFK